MSETEKTGNVQDFFGIDPADKSPVQIELKWFHQHYRGDIPQLTVRAVFIGVVLGGEKFSASAAQIWKDVAELLAHGLSSLDVTERWALIAGESLMGVLIAVLGAVGIMK